MNKLHFETMGTGPHIILLHGWGFSGQVWQDTSKILAQQFTVHVVDLPGYGRSQYADSFDYELESMSEEILRHINKPAIWVGWSLGGMIATYIASQRPDIVQQLVLVGSSPCFLEQPDWSGMKPPVLKKFNRLLSEDYRKTIKRFVALQFLGCDNEKNLIDKLQQVMGRVEAPSKYALAKGLHLLETADLRAEFAALSMPIKALFGRLDSLVPRAAVEKIAQLNANCHNTVFDKASHAPFLSHPQEFLEVIMNHE